MPETPERAEVSEVIDRLVSDGLTREEVSRWASERHLSVAADEVVEEALDALALFDARHGAGSSDYLYDYVDVLAIRQRLAGSDDSEQSGGGPSSS